MALTLFASLPIAPAAAATGGVRVDFNGDGFADLPVGVPGEDIAGVTDAGSVIVLYGNARGLGAGKTQVWHRDTAGVPGPLKAHEQFGTGEQVTGDFDGDGYTDLAVSGGRPYYVGSPYPVSSTLVLFGSPQGLRAADRVALTDVRPGVAGDIDTSAGGDELAVTQNPVDGYTRVLLYRNIRSDRWHSVIESGTHGLPPLDAPSVKGVGCALDATEYDDRSGEDLLIGQSEDGGSCVLWMLSGGPGGPPAEGPATNLGAVSPSGPIAAGSDTTGGLVTEPEGGTPFLSGGVDVRPYRATTFAGTITQETPGVPGVSERGDLFGASRGLVDLNGDGTLDLIVGVPAESIGDATRTGSVTVVHRGAGAGAPTASGNYVIHQNKAGVPGTNMTTDEFGSDVHGDDFDGDGTPDIVMSAPGDLLMGVRPGVLTVDYSRAALGYRRVQQNTTGIPGANETGDHFGDLLVK